MKVAIGNPVKVTKRIGTGVSPSVEGFFRVPPIWIGEAPEPESVKTFNPVPRQHLWPRFEVVI